MSAQNFGPSSLFFQREPDTPPPAWQQAMAHSLTCVLPSLQRLHLTLFPSLGLALGFHRRQQGSFGSGSAPPQSRCSLSRLA
jgi:hypothetical protein